jgi:hypothetical protein
MKPSNPLYPINQRLSKLRPHVTVQKMCLLVMQGDSSECIELLDDLLNVRNQQRAIEETFPGLAEEGYDLSGGWNGENLMAVLAESERLGYLAELHVPECTEFKFADGGEPLRWCVRGGISNVVYVYGNTLEELMEAMERAVAKEFAGFVEQARKQKA